MALSDLAVYSEYTYEAFTETLAQQVDLFNAASGGTIILKSAANQGDYSDKAFWAKIQGLVRRRNAYGSGAVSEKNLQHLIETMVKIAAGTPPVRIDPGMLLWIQQNEEVAGAVYGQQLAKDTLADMLNTALLIYVAALNGEATVYQDVSATDTTFQTLLAGSAAFGDASASIQGWAMHSKSMFDIFGAALTNTNQLFNFGTVNVTQDGFGRPFIVTDSPSLAYPDDDGAGPHIAGHYIAGMVQGAITIEMNGDFIQNVETKNGDENIVRTIQSEWSYNAGVKGYTWDKSTGGKSPNDAALATANNWDKIASNIKDTAGVLLKAK